MSIKKGTKLRCIDAKEPGIPITEGQVYTVLEHAKHGGAVFGDGTMPERHRIPGVVLQELPSSCFMLTRFEEVAA